MMALTPKERHRMGQAGRTHIEKHYEIERVLDQWEALYDELLVKKSRSAS